MATTSKKTMTRAKALPQAKEKPPADAAPAPVDPVSPADRPIVFRDAKNNLVTAFKVDAATITGRTVKVSGWSAGRCSLQLTCDGEAVPAAVARTRRADVAAALNASEPEEGFGFMMSAPGTSSGAHALRLIIDVDGHKVERSYPLVLKRELRKAQEGASATEARGFIEGAAASGVTGDAVVAGWVLQGQDVKVWLETEDGLPFSLAGAHRVYREDVLQAHGGDFGTSACDAGFIVRLEDVAAGQVIRLVAQQGDEPVVLAEAVCSPLPSDPVAASRWLLGLRTPLGDMHRRMPVIDMPVIQSLHEHQLRARADLPAVRHHLGRSPERPDVSIIVPLYGRADFVEHQLVEFSRDPWLLEHAELIYVVDDPKLVSPFSDQASSLHRLYGIPFQWVWGGTNRGFAGANNLGATFAKADHLLFLNSDVFPQAPGWLQSLLEVLAANKHVGAVGPRLVFANGGIQHAGMEFTRREDLGIWVNHHPLMGLDPSLDPAHELKVVPAITGACLAMRRAQFDKIGGWDTGYLIGDFEDSDLCLKLRSSGWDIAYVPSVQLTHLERQSFKMLGDGSYRTLVVIYNALRHQARWASMLGGPVSAAKV